MQCIEAAPTKASQSARWLPYGLGVLLVVVALAYLPSLGGGFLNWDDPWLLESNPMWQKPSVQVLWHIWTDLSPKTRHALGAEFLPVRDTSHFIEAWVTGIRPLPMRIVNLGLYLGALLALHHALRKQLVGEGLALLATAAFALHPVHVESVAWLAGRKDVLAMLFGALAFRAYASRCGRFVLVTAFWFVLAMLSKSMSVVLPLLLPVLDLWAKRRPNVLAIGVSLLVVALVMPIHIHVGQMVGMTQSRAGGSIATSLATMGPVWLQYVQVLLWPPHCSLVHEVPTLVHFTLISAASYFTFVVAGLVAIHRWYRGQRLLFVVLALVVIPLLPVSQVLVPLQNRMADRYLWWSVLGLAVLLAAVARRWPGIGVAAVLVILAFFTAVTAQRAGLFGDSALAFADATHKTKQSPIGPYQWAMALDERGEFEGARWGFEEAWRRTEGQGEVARRATNNLARLEFRLGNLDRAEQILRRGLGHFPADAKMRDNLTKVLARRQMSQPNGLEDFALEQPGR